MARTKTKPGPKPKYGEREDIHVRVPVEDMSYIRSVTDNVTEWVVLAIQEKRQRESKAEPEVADAERLVYALAQQPHMTRELFLKLYAFFLAHGGSVTSQHRSQAMDVLADLEIKYGLRVDNPLLKWKVQSALESNK